MSKVIVTKEKLDAIGDAIREKGGTTDKLTLDNMPSAINDISGGGVIKPLNVFKNGTYDATERIDGYAPINVAILNTPQAGLYTKDWELVKNFSQLINDGDITVNTTNNRITAISDYLKNYEGNFIFLNTIEYINNYVFQYAKFDVYGLPECMADVGGFFCYSSTGRIHLNKIPDAMKNTSSYSFVGDYVEVDDLNNLNTISDGTFARSKSNISVFPASINIIRNYAFQDVYVNGKSKVTEITFKGKPTQILPNAFLNSSNLKTINVPWDEGEVANAPWGAVNATINYNYVGE